MEIGKPLRALYFRNKSDECTIDPFPQSSIVVELNEKTHHITIYDPPKTPL